MAAILVIDDNVLILHVMNRILRKQGYEVATARTGKESIDKISGQFFDLAIIDLELPDMNGLDVSKVIAARSPKTQKIILTGLPPQKADRYAEQVDIYMKPIGSEELLKVVREKLSNQNP